MSFLIIFKEAWSARSLTLKGYALITNEHLAFCAVLACRNIKMSDLISAFGWVSEAAPISLSLITALNHLEDCRELLPLISAVFPLAIQHAFQYGSTLFQLLIAVSHLFFADDPMFLDANTAEGVPAWKSNRLVIVTVIVVANLTPQLKDLIILQLILATIAWTPSITSLLWRVGAVFVLMSFSIHLNNSFKLCGISNKIRIDFQHVLSVDFLITPMQ